jgi:hypothetical protein
LVDILLIERKIAELDTYLRQIKEFERIPLKKYRSDWKI